MWHTSVGVQGRRQTAGCSIIGNGHDDLIGGFSHDDLPADTSSVSKARVIRADRADYGTSTSYPNFVQGVLHTHVDPS